MTALVDGIELRFTASVEATAWAPAMYEAAAQLRDLVRAVHPGGDVPPGRRLMTAELVDPTPEQRHAGLQRVVFEWPQRRLEEDSDG